MAVDRIADGIVVSLAYKLTVDGEVIEEAPNIEPLEYLHGADNIVPGLEQKLAGKQVGDKVSVTLEPEDAYGHYNEENMEVVDRADMPDEIEVGMELLLEDEFGNYFEVTVAEINENDVVLDFNPPLAGKTVTYDAEVVALREADDEEKSHGHPHSYEEDAYDYAVWDDEDES